MFKTFAIMLTLAAALFFVLGIFYNDIDWSILDRQPSQLDLYVMSIWALISGLGIDIQEAIKKEKRDV